MNEQVKEYLMVWGIITLWMLFCCSYFWIPEPIGLVVSIISIFLPLAVFIFLCAVDVKPKERNKNEQKNS